MALIRLSGSKSVAIAESVSTWKFERSGWHSASFSQYLNGDDGLVTAFPVGKSFTGEETVEMSVHGSSYSVQALTSACIDSGARFAEPGEFTYRAFMNGKLDLTQAEGVRDTVEALTATQLRQANLLRDGALKDDFSKLRDRLIGVLAAIEASTDFSEEIGDFDSATGRQTLATVSHSLQSYLESAERSKKIRNGLTVALVGRPNVGKSSLLNAITRSDRAIVTPHPGTTRDTISEVIEVNGVAIRFVDTAGLRISDNEIEQLGIQRSRFEAENADEVWFVFDASCGWSSEDALEHSELRRPVTVVANKCDLLPIPTTEEQWPVSAKTGFGLPELLDSLTERLSNQSVPLVNDRHVELVRSALSSLQEVDSVLNTDSPTDLAVVGLRSAIRFLGEITGETTPPDVIHRIFHDFCIGK